jgi:molybdopterin converting factor small subunit
LEKNAMNLTEPEITIRILFFAQAREQAQSPQGYLKFSNRRIKPKDILQNLLTSFPALIPLQDCIILALNQNYLDIDSDQELELRSTDELAVIPPISAG